jgi:hypothetical protein
LKSTFVSNSHSLPAFETVYSRQKFSDKFGWAAFLIRSLLQMTNPSTPWLEESYV